MISFRDGVLKINLADEQKAKILYEIFFVINIVTIFAFYNVKFIGTATSIMTFVCAMFIWTARKKEKEIIPYNFVWYGTFIIYNILSWMWSTYIYSDFLSSAMKMIVILLITVSISIYVDTPNDLDRLMSAFILGMVINISIEFISAPVDDWFKGAMGSHISAYNANEIAFWAVCAELMAFYKAYIKNKKFFYILVVFFAFFTILTSSRKATIAALLGPIIMMTASTYKKSFVLKIFGMIGIMAAIGYLIMTDENLYNVIGRRFNSMKNYLSDGTIKSDTSMYLRNYYINIAKDLFYDSPIVGKGMGNFSCIISNEYGALRTYAHNNYWQILSENGIVGFILYYSFYVYMIVKIVRNMITKKSRISIMFLTLMVLLIGLEWGIVTVNTKTSQIIIAMAYTATYVGEVDGRKYQYIKNNTNTAEEMV